MYEEKLKELGLEVPQMAAPVANYVPCVVENGWLYISGQLPMVNGQLAAAGKLGDGLDVEQGYEAAKICALNCLGAIKQVLGTAPLTLPPSLRLSTVHPICSAKCLARPVFMPAVRLV